MAFILPFAAKGMASQLRDWINHLRRRPAIMLAVLLILGMALGIALPLHIIVYLIAAFAAWLIAVIFIKHGHACNLFLATAIIFLGISAEQLDRCAYPTDAIANFTTDLPRLARLRLRITDPPRILQGQWHQSKQLAHAAVFAARCGNGWLPVTGDITVHLSNSASALHIGDQIESLGWLTRPLPADNPGEFDWLSYYRHQRILASFQITDPACIRLLRNDGTNLLWHLRQNAHDLLLRGFNAQQTTNAAMLDALLLGDRTPAERDIQDLFVQTGTPHLVVISGMHVFIVAAFVYLICRLLRIRPRVSAVTVMFCVLLYGLLVLPSLPAARAVLFCELTFLGVIFRRSIDLLQVLGICACIILVARPMELTDVGFQLSLVGCFVLVIYHYRIAELMATLHGDPSAPGNIILDPIRPSPIWRMPRNASIASCIGWLAILPLILFYFNRLNPWALFGGVALTPFVFIAVIAGLLKILLTLIVPWLVSFWATAATFSIAILIKSVGWLALLPGGDVLEPAPSVSVILIYYGLLLLPLIAWKISWRWVRFSPLAGLVLLVIPWPLAIAQQAHPPLRLTILSVGAGSCCIVESPEGHTVIIDAGSSTIPDLERTVIKPFLRQRQIRYIDDLFISHPDADHYNAVQQTVDDFPTHQVIIDNAFVADAQGSYGASRLVDWLDQSHHPARIISAGENIFVGKDLAISTLWPPTNSHFGHNDDSLVLRLLYAGRSILIPGDIESLAERVLINTRPDLSCDVLIAPHHGSSVDMTPFFVARVNPQLIISSNDRTPTSKQKRFLHEIGNRPIYRTSECGAVMVTIDAVGKMTIRPFVGNAGLRTAAN